MAKNTNRVACLIAYVAALGLATSASAYHWEMYVNNPVTYAKEVFGGDDPAAGGVTLSADDPMTTDDATTAEVQENDEQTSVDLMLRLPEDTTIGADSELEVTLSLTGATLGQAVDWTDIVADDDADAAVASASFQKVGGSQMDGRRGDSSVTFKVHVPTGQTVARATGGAQVTNYIRLDLGSLNGYAGAGPVSIGASMRVTDGPQNNFPTTFEAVEAVAAKPEVTDDPATTGTDESSPAVPAVRGTSGMVANAITAVTFDGANGGTGNINLDDRTKLVGGTKVAVGSLSFSTMPAMEKDGMTDFADGDGAEFDVHVTVTGMVRDTDTVFYSEDDMMDSDKEKLSITDGVATGTFRNGNGTAYFMPDGETPMRAGSLTAMFSIEYDATSVVDPGDEMGGGKLVYNGVDMQARAYAIPPAMHMDEGNVRIKCEADGDAKCTVFLDCNEQDGMARFGELGDTIAAGATMHLTGASIREVLGGDDWTGRLSCDVLSANDVSVQVLVRSGDVLVNNTYVD